MAFVHEPVEGGLRNSVYRATRWQAFESISAQAITFLSMAVLARMLDARDFGLVAVVMLLLGLYEVFMQVGLASNLVRVPRLDPRAASSTHWVMMGLGLTLFTTAIVGADPLARLLGSPDAGSLFRIASLVLLFSTCTATPYALLYRKLAFDRLATISISGNVGYLLCAVALAAIFGLGAWAVIIGRVVQAAIRALLSFMLAGWRPSFTFDGVYIRGAASFAGGMWLAWVATYAVKNVDYALLSRLGPGEAVGVYYLAFTVPQLLRQRFTVAMQQVLFPILVRTQGDSPRTRRILAEGYGTLALVLAPAMVGLAVIAPDAVRLAFGPGWDEAVPPLRLLAVAGLFAIFSPLASSAIEAAGKPGRNVGPTAAQVITIIGAFFVLREFLALPSAMAAGVLAAVLVRIVVDGRVLSKLGIAPAFLWMSASYRALLAAVLMAAPVALAHHELSHLPLFIRVAGSVGTGVACYAILVTVLDRAGLRRTWATLGGIMGRSPSADPSPPQDIDRDNAHIAC